MGNFKKLFFSRSKHCDFDHKSVARGTWPKCHVICMCDVNRLDSQQIMAENKRKPTRKGGRFCAAGTPNKESCMNTGYTPGISMHLFPSDPTVRAKWVKFVQRHRVDFKEPIGKYTSLCSAHFEQSCFENSLASSLEGMEGIKLKRNLIRGSIPTRDSFVPGPPQVLTEREKRQVSLS